MEDILNIIVNKNKIDGKFNIKTDDDVIVKPFTITADSKYFKSKNITVELDSINNLNNLKLDISNLESISIWLISDKKIVFKKINNKTSTSSDIYNKIITELLNNSNTSKYITYLINDNRQIFIFYEKKDIVNKLETDEYGFKNITEDFKHNSLLNELNIRINKL